MNPPTPHPEPGPADGRLSPSPVSPVEPSPRPRPACRRIALFNRKGGVGKTTTAVNLALGLAQLGQRVLLVDYDDQADACSALGIADSGGGPDRYNTAHLTRRSRPFDPLRNVLVPGLDLVPAMRVEQMQELEGELARNRAEGRRALARALAEVASLYDYLLVDCSPTLNILVEAALYACSEVLIPVGMEGGMMKASLDVLERVNLGKTSNPELRVLGILPTHYDLRLRDSRACLALTRQVFRDQVLQTRIHASAAIKRAGLTGRPVILEPIRVRASREYQALVEEVIRRGH